MRTMLVFVMILTASSLSTARTWFVEKDGSGDYTVIQDAVEASADGDTIRIGAGRFDDYRRYDVGSAWVDQIIHVFLDGRSLTFIGDGEGSTVIGPLVEFDRTEHDKGISLVNGSELRISDLTLERCYSGLESWDTCFFEATKCTFQHHTWGYGSSVFSSAGARYDRCRLVDYSTGLGLGSGSVGVVVQDCEFQSVLEGITTTSTMDLVVVDCTIDAIVLGIQLWAGSSGSIVNTTVSGGSVAINVEAGSELILQDSQLEGGSLGGLMVLSGSTLTGSNNVIRFGDRAVIELQRSSIFLSESHVISSGSYALLCSYSTPGENHTLNLRNNWWSVSDADSIADLIWDGNDDAGIYAVVDFQPFKDGPVPNEGISWSNLKTLYR